MTFSHLMTGNSNSKRKTILKTDFLIAIGLTIFFLIIYLAWQTRLYNLDALITSWRISTSSWTENFYPHHLLYIPIMTAFHFLINSVAHTEYPVYSLQILNSILGAITIGISYIFSTKFLKERWSALFVALIMGFSFTFWHWSTDADPYIPVNLILIVALYNLYNRGKKSNISIVINALLFAVAILIHQMSLVLILPAVIIIYIKSDDRQHFIKLALLFLGFALIPVLGVYLLVSEFIYSDSSLGSGLKFFFFHGSNPQNWIFLREGFPKFLPAYIYHGILGHYNLFIFSAGSGRYEIFEQYAGPLYEESVFFRFILPVLIMIGSMWLLIRAAIGNIRNLEPGKIFLLSWILPLFIFLLIWNPGYSFHRIFYLFPFLLIIFLNLESYASGKRTSERKIIISFLGILIGTLFFYNAFTAIIPQSNSIDEYDTAIELAGILQKGDLLIATMEEEYLTRMVRCFTLCERMLEGDYPKAVPALGSISTLNLDNLNESGMPAMFDSIFISKTLHSKWKENNKITISFRIADDLVKRKIELEFGNWEIIQPEVHPYVMELKLKNLFDNPLTKTH